MGSKHTTAMRAVTALAAAAALLLPCAAPGQTVPVNDAATWADALAQIAVGDTEVVFAADLANAEDRFTWDVPMTIPIRHEIKLRGTGPLPWNLVLSPPGATLDIPLFDIQQGGSLTLERLAFDGGSTVAMLSDSDAALTLDRCYVENTLGAGVEIGMSGGDATISNSVFTKCGAQAIRLEAGRADIIGCTLIRNVAGSISAPGGVVNAVATVFYENNLPPEAPGPGSQAYACYFGPEGPGSLLQTGAIAAPPPMLEFETDSVWAGNLREGLGYENNVLRVETAAFTQDELDAFNGFLDSVPKLDFQNDLRAQPQAGADHVDDSGIGPMRRWVDCVVTPAPVGLNRPFTVELFFSHTTDVTEILVKPQLVGLTNPSNIDPALLLAPQEIENFGIYARATFNVPDTFVSFGGNDPIPVDGTARVYVRAEGTWWGLGTANVDVTDQPALDGSQFIIDTTPPRMELAFLRARGNDLLLVNNTGPAPATTTGAVFPGDWAPGTMSVPSSNGTLDGDTGNAQVFLNSYEPLDISIQLQFIDEAPPDADGEPYAGITPGGFVDETLAPLTSAAATGIADPLFIGYDRPGTAFWTGSVANVDTALNYAPGAAVTTTQGSVSQTQLQAQWQLANLAYYDGWRVTAGFGVTDLAGNQFVTPGELDIWWMANAFAELTSGPSGGGVVDPIFRWQLQRLVAPQNAYPCYPLVQFRVWAANAAGTGWDAVSQWSDWLADPLIDRNTPVLGGQRLGILLSDGALKGADLMLTVRGADEAGNVQPVQTALDNIFDIADLDSGAGPPQAWVWENAGEQRALETEAQVEFWHNRVLSAASAPEMWGIDPDERTFGSSPRVPLPPLDEVCGKRVEGRFTFTANLPDDLGSPGDAIIVWSLFEEGRRVAYGTIAQLDATFKGVIQIPQDLLLPGATPYDVNVTEMYPFLNLPPEECAVSRTDRLGDEGDPQDASGRPLRRQRDVEYLLVGYAQESAAATGFAYPPAKDSTPVSIRFTVTTGKDVGGEEQPIKVFSRGG